MYLYDDLDRTLVTERVAEFRDQVARRLSGELTEEEFKPLRLMNGVYLQLHAYMLRTAIPYGTLLVDATTEAGARRAPLRSRLRATSPPARTFSTTGSSSRNCRTPWPTWPTVGMHGMQTSGNCVRNITDRPVGRRCA